MAEDNINMTDTFEEPGHPLASTPSWIHSLAFVVEGVLLLAVACLGLLGCGCSFIVLSTQAVQKTFHNLLLLLSIFDLVYLVAALPLFSLPKVCSSPLTLNRLMAVLPYMLPVAQIGMVGSIYSTVALSVERYLAVVHPFAKYRHKFSSRHFVVPVVLYSVLFNIPKFLELTTVCPEQSRDFNITTNKSLSWGQCHMGDLKLEPRDLRLNSLYLNIYVLWMNTILNIFLPIVSLIVLNTMVTRKIEQHLRNLDRTTQTPSTRLRSTQLNVLDKERSLRKREVNLSRINVYIAVIIVTCHSIRFLPNAWEIIQRLSLQAETDLHWPPWLDVVVILSHLALTLSCSLSFYIYYGKYGNPRKGLKVRLQGVLVALKLSQPSDIRVSSDNLQDREMTEMVEVHEDFSGDSQKSNWNSQKYNWNSERYNRNSQISTHSPESRNSRRIESVQF